ncbi:MAG: NAD(P)(+) transhydrogenase (Re/Si-specific) subunit beta, partial [Desulfitobacteriaceae bacterium]|nr:NAD(P)(+) transhydrogenase (Re/Si-specific) subunit beta [Desulfitobacteriaceae bacterium]
MSSTAYNAVSLILIIGIILGINFMSSPKTAAKGNWLSAVCMAIAIIITLVSNGIVSYKLLWVCMLIGGMFGLYLALKVKMIQMPQMVAAFNGFGGAASALVGILVLTDPTGITIFSQGAGALALIVGGVTFSGSMIAAAKLAQLMNQRPVVLNGHSMISGLTIAIMAGLLILTTVSQGTSIVVLTAITVLVALFFGVLFTIRVGGADMPITISLLNSLSGVAGSIAGFAIYDGLLVAVGGIVGASGLLLTQIMCRAMNRSLTDILTGKTSISVTKKNNKQKTDEQKVAVSIEETKKDDGDILGEAK